MAKLDPWLVDILNRMAESIVAVVGPHCEIVVYDFDDLEHSVVAVAGNVTGREVGAPVPDLQFISRELNRNTPDKLNYRTRKGTRDLQSSLIWIRDVRGEPIGAIGVNIDHTDLLQVRALIDNLAASTQTVTDVVVSNTFAKDLDDLIDIAVSDFLRKNNIPNIETMPQDDKLRLIAEVEKQELFRIRGAVNRMADLLNVSRATIYNYRASLKNGS